LLFFYAEFIEASFISHSSLFIHHSSLKKTPHPGHHRISGQSGCLQTTEKESDKQILLFYEKTLLGTRQSKLDFVQRKRDI